MDSGSLAWVLISAALVLFMTPGLAFFYGGMDRSRNVLNMLMMNFWCLLIVPILWVIVGLLAGVHGHGTTSSATSTALFLDGIGITRRRRRRDDRDDRLPRDVRRHHPGADLGCGRRPHEVLGLGDLRPGLDRSSSSCPVFKWVYGGWLGERGSLDFAGGTAIHVNAGIAALAAVLVLGKRKGWPTEGHPPHSMPLVMIGTGILWFGWFGFNAGSALAANGQAAQAFMNTFLAAAAAGLAWALVERIRDGHFTNLGAASGIVAGLVAITPAAGFVSGVSPDLIGVVAGRHLLLRRQARRSRPATTTPSTSSACTSSAASSARC